MAILKGFAALVVVLVFGATSSTTSTNRYDVVIYGGTSAAVMAAVQVAKMQKSVVIVSPDKHLGGLSSGGLGNTDSGLKEVIGGLSRDFYQRIYRHYHLTNAWKWQTKEEFGNPGRNATAIDHAQQSMWVFEPHVAERIFEGYIKEYRIPVLRNAWLDRTNGVSKLDGRITSIATLNGRRLAGKIFIDATYEGDLMAAAGVSYYIGREGQAMYGEAWNGVQVDGRYHFDTFLKAFGKISPYRIPDDPRSGLVARVSSGPPGRPGEGDRRLQAYCFRMCLTDNPDNRIPFTAPDGYDPSQYELLVRVFDKGWRDQLRNSPRLPNRKTDTNTVGPFSFDNVGYNWDYPDASYERRGDIITEHKTYQQGMMFFMATDPRVPQEVRDQMRNWGYAKDEFQDTDGWPYQLYIREARRMIGSFVMTQNELEKERPTPNSVGMGSYVMDSHHVQRYITPDGYVQNEGAIRVPIHGGPYEIAYESLVPKREQVSNLLVPVAVSSSHIAYGSIRMEPVFMILGQSAATAAVIALTDQLSVQDVPYIKLRDRLLTDGQVLTYAKSQSTGVP